MLPPDKHLFNSILRAANNLGVKFGSVQFGRTKKSTVYGTYTHRTRGILISSELPFMSQMIVLLHELGHALYYTIYSDDKVGGSSLTETLADLSHLHLERMADSLGWVIASGLPGADFLKREYRRMVLGDYVFTYVGTRCNVDDLCVCFCSMKCELACREGGRVNVELQDCSQGRDAFTCQNCGVVLSRDYTHFFDRGFLTNYLQ